MLNLRKMKIKNTWQNMSIKLIPCIFSFLLPTVFFQSSAHSIPTQWDDAKMSMKDLLNIGWRLTSHGTNRVAANSNSGNSFDVETFSFILTNGDKYIICFVENPRPPVANAASCRRLN
jgi:hypothetical protein